MALTQIKMDSEANSLYYIVGVKRFEKLYEARVYQRDRSPYDPIIFVYPIFDYTDGNEPYFIVQSNTADAFMKVPKQ